MAQMYQQYERQQVHHISDPAVRQQHPVSTIFGVTDGNNHSPGPRITEVVDTNDQATQHESDEEADEESTEDKSPDAYKVLGFEPSVADFMRDVVNDVVDRVEGEVGNKVTSTENAPDVSVPQEERHEAEGEASVEIQEPQEDLPVKLQPEPSPAEPQSQGQVDAEEKESNLTGEICTFCCYSLQLFHF